MATGGGGSRPRPKIGGVAANFCRKAKVKKVLIKCASVDNPERRFRLRQDTKIVGFMRKLSARMVLYSRDGFWWRGHSIDYDELDEYVGLRDRNNRYIYEWDILHFKIDPDGDYTTGVVLWEGRQKIFGIKAIEEGSFIPLHLEGLVMFQSSQLEVFSYLFLNPELKAKLGVRD